MNICITRSQKFSYSETFIQNQIRYLSEKANVFTLHSGRMPEREEDGSLIHPYPFWLVNKLVKLVAGRNNWFSHFGLRRYLKRHHIDLVLANYGLSAVHIFPVCKELGIPLVVHFHGYDASKKSVLKQYGKAYQLLFKYATAIVVVSNVMRERLMALGAPAEKLFLISYGVDPEKFRPCYERKDTTAIDFLAVGRFTAKKAPMTTIRAFSKAAMQNPLARLEMAGAREGLYEECLQLVKELGLEDRVHFAGVLSPEEVAARMCRADIFVQHSITAADGDMEGMPLSILEAAASGLPVISTKSAGIPDAVINGSTGFLVNENDEKAMADCMIKLAGDKLLAEEMGRAARIHIKTHHNLALQTEKLYQLLVTIIQEKKAIHSSP